MRRTGGLFPEVQLAVLALSAMAALAFWFRLPIVVPSGERSAFLGIHYVYPLIGALAIAGAIHAYSRRTETLRALVALPCYLAVLFAHFNMKLWVPLINPTLLDGWLWQTDALFPQIIAACMRVRMALWAVLPPAANAYMLIFIMMFYVSFIYHAMRTPERLRELMLAVMIMQFAGSLLYLALPALGPFVFEAGINPISTASQQYMLEFHRRTVAEGAPFLVAHGGENFTGALAAMPSLHNAGALLFLLFARAYNKPLVPYFALASGFIAVSSIASRWHYLIDLPAGWLLACFSFWVAHAICSREDRERLGDAAVPMHAAGALEA